MDRSSMTASTPPPNFCRGIDGNFYGITEYGGAPIPGQGAESGTGTVFKMTPTGTVTILHSFGPWDVSPATEHVRSV